MSETEVAKIQLREHLSSLLIPRLAEGFWSILESSQKLCDQNKQLDQVLRTFQNMVTKIPEWSDSVLTEEVERIMKASKCSYMDDLLMGVFLAYMKSFAALHYRGHSSQIKVEFERPNVTKFIHELYKHSARKLWQSAYLFKVTGVPSEQQAKNRQEIEQIVYKTLDDVIRAFLPWEIIAKSYFVEPREEDKPAPLPVSKSVVFEDIPDTEDEESDEEESPKIHTLKITDEQETLDFVDLDKPEEEIVVPELPKEVDPLEEIERNISDDKPLVLKM